MHQASAAVLTIFPLHSFWKVQSNADEMAHNEQEFSADILCLCLLPPLLQLPTFGNCQEQDTGQGWSYTAQPFSLLLSLTWQLLQLRTWLLNT